MRILLRALPIFLFLGLCTASLAQSNNAPDPAVVDVVQAPQNGNGSNANGGVSIINSNGQQDQNTNGSTTPLTPDQIANINQSIALLQSQLEQINDPNDPKAIKLQETIDRLQGLLNQ